MTVEIEMSSNTDTNPSPTIDRTQARGTQFTPVFTQIGEFLASTRKSISIPVKFAVKTAVCDWNEENKAYVDITYSRSEMRVIVTQMIDTCMDNCSGTFSTNIPARSGYTYTELASYLAFTYTVTKGANKDTVRNHFAHFMAAARSTLNYASKAQDLQETVDNGDAWAAQGVVDKNGDLKPYITEVKARKAWARVTVGDDWWVNKAGKADLLASAVVFMYNSNGAITMDTIRSMHHVQVRTLAAKAGAPTSITEGTGAKARSINWFSEDTARIVAAQV